MDAPVNVTPKRRLRWLKALALSAGGLLLLIMLTLSALWWWAGTEGSLASALRWIGQSQPLVAERATGSLRAGGHVDQLLWQKDGLRVEARNVSLAWQPWSLLQGQLTLNQLTAGSVQVDDQRVPSKSPAPPTMLGLPLPVALDAFSVAQLRWTGPTALTGVSASGISGRYQFNGLQRSRRADCKRPADTRRQSGGHFDHRPARQQNSAATGFSGHGTRPADGAAGQRRAADDGPARD
jgi:translocation and assembly module TamB